MPTKLTDKTVTEIAAPESGTRTVWDTEVTGFGVRVFPARLKGKGREPAVTRSFFLNYRAKGVERRFKIGLYGDWSVAAARARAKELRQEVDRGEDPAASKRATREAPTVSDLAERYYLEHLPNKAARSQKEDRRIIEAEILPRLGNGRRKVADIHQGDIAEIHRAITQRGVPIRANRVLAVASKMFSLALVPKAGDDKPWRDQLQGNPCKGIGRNHEEGRERFFSPAELAAISDALAEYPNQSTADLVRFMTLTGCRPGEAFLAKWEQVDTEPGFWVKPSAHTKQRKQHRVPLSPPALELLNRRRAGRNLSETDFIFPGRKAGAPPRQVWKIWKFVIDRATVRLWKESPEVDVAELVNDLEAGFGRLPSVRECEGVASRRGVKLPVGLRDSRPYDLRHSYASTGASGGLSLQIIGRLLGHTQARTTQRYAHLGDDALREAADRIGNAIAGSGKPSTVEQIRARR